MSSDLEDAISRAIAQGLNHTETAALLKAEGHDVSRWTVSRRARRAAGEDRPLVETPELPEADLPVEELLARRVEDFGRKRVARQARDRIPVRVNVEGPIGIAFVGDPHVDGDGTDVETLFRHADLLAENDAILSINLGDTRNNWVGRLARLYGEQGTSAKQALQLAKHYLERARFDVVLSGNHDKWAGVDDPLAAIVKASGGLYEADRARLDFQLPSGRSVMVDASHDHPGRTMYSPQHGAAKRAKFDGSSHIYACGHLHEFGYQPVWDAGRRRLCHAIRVASYKVYDSYADSLYLDHGLPVVCPVALVDPRWPDSSPNFIRWELDPEEAVERLRWMRAQA